MKSLKFFLIAALAFAFAAKAQAQGRYGKDSADCVINLNFYQEEYKKKDYKAALKPWREAMKFCPANVSQNFYIHGINIMRTHLRAVKDPQEKQKIVDTLTMLYDRRMENFKTNKVDLLYRKASLLDELAPERKEDIYKAFKAAVDADNKKVELHAVAKTMLAAKDLYEAKTMPADQFTELYTGFAELVEDRIKTAKDSAAEQEAKTVKLAIDNSFITTEAANCDNLIALFGPRFNANKDDIATVRLIVSMLNKRECTQNDLYYQVAEAYYKLDPSPGSAYTLAKMFYAKGEMDKCIEYFKNAIDGQTDVNDKSQYQVELAGLLLGQGQSGQAISYARQAISTNSRNGQAYMILGTAYAGYKSCGDDPVSRRSVFWVAVDQFYRAKQVDPSVTDDANKQINTFSQHFPSYDDCFDQDILDGQTYTVSCGPINERTKVRTRK